MSLRYRYTKSGERIDNITDWAFNKFVARYGKKPVALPPRPLAGGAGGGQRSGAEGAGDEVLAAKKKKGPPLTPPACGRGTEVSKDVLVADYKEPMIELLARVVRVSVETVTITEAMRGLDRAGWE